MNRFLDVSPLEKAIVQLEDSLNYYHSDLSKSNRNLSAQFRSAAIQAFEYTYELSWKMLKRYLEMISPNPEEIDGYSFSDLIRAGNEKGLLLSDLEKWLLFRTVRSITSHTYDEAKAEEVFKVIPVFLKDAHYLVEKLQ